MSKVRKDIGKPAMYITKLRSPSERLDTVEFQLYDILGKAKLQK